MMPAPATVTPEAPEGRYKWALVGMLWFICFFNYADRQAISAVLPVLESEFHFTKQEQGLIAGAFMWVYGASAPLAGMVGDGWSRKLVILGGLYVWSLITGLTASCHKVWHFAVVRGAEGLGETFYFPASMSLVSDYHGPATRSRAMALHQTSVYAGIIGGGVVTGWLAQRFGWQFPFIAFGAAGILLSIVLARFVHEPARRTGQPAEDTAGEVVPWPVFVGQYLGRPASLCLLLAFVGANVVAGVFYVWTISYVKTKFRFDLATASVVGTVYLQVASMIGSTTGGFLADWLRLRWLGGRVAVQALGLGVGAPMILLVAWGESLTLVVTGMLALGFCKGIYDSNIWASMYEVVPASRRSSAVGLANMVGWGGAGVGSWQLGRLVDSNMPMSTAMAWTAVIYLVGAVLLTLAALVFVPDHIRRWPSAADAPPAP